MSAPALAETTTQTFEPVRPHFEVLDGGGETSAPTGELQVVPECSLVSELPGDTLLVERAQRNIKTRLVGDLVVAKTVETKQKPIKNLREGVLWADAGDPEGIAMVDSNVGTEMIEQAYKAGNVITIDLEVDDNDISQNGQRMGDIQRNAYQLASEDEIIKPRTEAEANNAARIKHYYDQGLLEDHVFLRFSLCAEGVSDEKLDELKFFSTTKSMSVQMAYSDQGKLRDDVAMVAGVRDAESDRHDRRMVEAFYRKFGKSCEGMSAPEIIDNGLLIPKKYFKNGVVDFVRILEEDEGTFFGQDVPEDERMKYEDMPEFCRQRAKRFNEDVISVRNKLVKEIGRLNDPISVMRRMAKLVEAKVVNRALKDTSIDPNVMGKVSAAYIVEARAMEAAGRHQDVQHFMTMARSTAQGGSCPVAIKDGIIIAGAAEAESKKEVTADEDDLGARKFTCTEGHWNYRKVANVKETKCQTKGCKGSVGC